MILNNMDFPTFIEYIKDKEVLCFGAGRMLKRLCLAAYVEPYVKAVFDNDTKKHNKKIEYAGQFFDVRSPLDIDKFEISAEKTVALITASMSNAGRALYDELEKIERLSRVECFFLSFIFKEPGSMERVGKALNFRLTDKPLIPKEILIKSKNHKISKKSIPKGLKLWYNRYKNKHGIKKDKLCK